MARYTLIAMVLAAVVAVPVHAAKLYKWVDQYGNVSYQDRPPPEGQGKVEEKSVRDGYGGGDSGSPSNSAAASKFPVTLYVVPRCSQCDLARIHLKKRKVPFTESDVSEKNPQAQEEMRKKVNDLIVPTITVGSKVMKGYMESLLDGELDAAGYTKAPENAPPPAAESQENLAPQQ